MSILENAFDRDAQISVARIFVRVDGARKSGTGTRIAADEIDGLWKFIDAGNAFEFLTDEDRKKICRKGKF